MREFLARVPEDDCAARISLCELHCGVLIPGLPPIKAPCHCLEPMLVCEHHVILRGPCFCINNNNNSILLREYNVLCLHARLQEQYRLVCGHVCTWSGGLVCMWWCRQVAIPTHKFGAKRPIVSIQDHQWRSEPVACSLVLHTCLQHTPQA